MPELRAGSRTSIVLCGQAVHLLRMTAGNAFRWAADDADHPCDPVRDFLATPLVTEPGST